MISIVTAYYNRKKLFKRTLQSIKNQNYKNTFEVIAVDDGSDEHERLEELTKEFPFLKVIRLEKKNKWYQNSCIPFNIGFRAAKGDKIIIQNPECLHFGNILEYTENNLTDKNYLSFACFSLDKESTENLDVLLKTPSSINEIIAKDNHIVKNDGDAGWYNHSIHRPEAYHFCTAISKKSLKKLNGFDERFALGIAFDDNEFVERIELFLNIKFIDEEIILHQNHYSPTSTSYQNRADKTWLFNHNSFIFKNRVKRFNYSFLLNNSPFAYKKNVIKGILKFESALRILKLKKSNTDFSKS